MMLLDPSSDCSFLLSHQIQFITPQLQSSLANLHSSSNQVFPLMLSRSPCRPFPSAYLILAGLVKPFENPVGKEGRVPALFLKLSSIPSSIDPSLHCHFLPWRSAKDCQHLGEESDLLTINQSFPGILSRLPDHQLKQGLCPLSSILHSSVNPPLHSKLVTTTRRWR